jgi:uncharacterized integral membrane protein
MAVPVSGASSTKDPFAPASGTRRPIFNSAITSNPFHLTESGSPAKQSATPGHTPSPLFPTVTLVSSLIAMGFKIFLRIVVFLAMLFVLLYVGMNNTQPIAFSFPMAFAKGVAEPAALIYFGIFSIGVVAGAMLNFGGGKKSSAKSEKK